MTLADDVVHYFLPEMLISARSMQGAMGLLWPLLVKQGVQPAGRAILATVHGDLHDIGKNLVSLMLEGAGFEVHDLGVDMGAETIVRAPTPGKTSAAAPATSSGSSVTRTPETPACSNPFSTLRRFPMR